MLLEVLKIRKIMRNFLICFFHFPKMSHFAYSVACSMTLCVPSAEIMKACSIAKSLSDQQPFAKHSDSLRTDMSEGSTNTDDYITCTDASKRGTMPANVTISAITQPPPPGLRLFPPKISRVNSFCQN